MERRWEPQLTLLFPAPLSVRSGGVHGCGRRGAGGTAVGGVAYRLDAAAAARPTTIHSSLLLGTDRNTVATANANSISSSGLVGVAPTGVPPKRRMTATVPARTASHRSRPGGGRGGGGVSR